MLSEEFPDATVLQQQLRPSRPRGVESAFTDAQLWNRRDQLVQAVEGYWGRVGRELPRAKRAEEVVEIFRPLLEVYVSDIISVYCRPSAQPASGKRLRKLRIELKSVTTPWL